jgi:hypothetical protein
VARPDRLPRRLVASVNVNGRAAGQTGDVAAALVAAAAERPDLTV